MASKGRYRVITNTMLCPVTRLSCVYSGVAFAGSGGAFWSAEANVRRFDGSDSPH